MKFNSKTWTFLSKLEHRIAVTDKSYYRKAYQSYMSAVEWRNVEMANEFAVFLKDRHSMFHYPYFSQTAELWSIFGKSCRAARRHNKYSEIIVSEYMLMSLFVGVFTSIELLPKGILSLFLNFVLPSENPHSEMQTHLSNYYTEYAHKLETVPFYEHNYTEAYYDLSKKYRSGGTKSWTDWFTWQCLSTEIRCKELISVPLRYLFHKDDYLATTKILVKYQVSKMEHLTEAQAIDKFISKIKQIHSQLPNTVIEILDSHIYTDKSSVDGSMLIYALLNTPRFRAFIPVVNALAEHQIQVEKIAGQENIQVKCNINAVPNGILEKVNKLPHVTPLYQYFSSNRYRLFNVLDVNGIKGTQTEFIHNF